MRFLIMIQVQTTGGAILTDNQVVAFAIGEQISDDMARIFREGGYRY